MNKFKVGDKVRRTGGVSFSSGLTVEIVRPWSLRFEQRPHMVQVTKETWESEEYLELVSRAEPEYKTWGEMTDEEKGALLLAHHEGKTIEFFNVDKWVEVSHPYWAHLGRYRVKPEPVVEKVCLHGSNNMFDILRDCRDTHKITFNTIDGEPDCNSVKMSKL